MKEQFIKIATDFATKAKLDAKFVIDGGAFDANGTLCSILFDENINPNECFLYCDMGSVPGQGAESALRNLLAQNYDAYAVAAARFSVSPANGHAIYTVAIDLAHATGDTLLNEIKGATELGDEWRKSSFANVQMSGPKL
ncbi:CesT family type III secretion system chaperone [Hydrogenophaga sp.]|uniref:CesT family type III secretion system chaperone n=1 Tax=Hydrogenophaga sp. TaxID=1904254 RepID=UPI003D11F6C7